MQKRVEKIFFYFAFEGSPSYKALCLVFTGGVVAVTLRSRSWRERGAAYTQPMNYCVQVTVVFRLATGYIVIVYLFAIFVWV